ncbi:UNVERIFIED_CONTAM: membrane-bound alpha-1,6- mannosyltransferase Initiation-specific [Siphonaria sp. JEL0065]|nr:membrane-bound alpha-1,6- mannosyltransferase Initiation-specific [Siphonaria sp. JEL0065]
MNDESLRLIVNSTDPRLIPSQILRPIRVQSRLALYKEVLKGDVEKVRQFRSWAAVNKDHVSILFSDDDLDRFVKGGFSKRINRAYFKLPVETRRQLLSALATASVILLWAIGHWYLDLLALNGYHDHFNGVRTEATLYPGANFDGTQSTQIPNYILRIFKTTNISDIEQAAINGTDHADRYKWFKTWNTQNPHHIQILLDDDQIARFVRGSFNQVVQDAYFKLPRIVQRSDFARYLLLYEIGGVYTDMDTECWTPIEDWSFGHYGVKGIVGIEVFANLHNQDSAYGMKGLDQVAQWTMALAPKHPFLEKLVRELTLKIHRTTEKELTDVNEVIGFTGPAFWSYVLWEYFREREFELERMMGLDRSYRVYGDIMILGRTKFFKPGTFSRHRGTGEMKNGWKTQKVPELGSSDTTTPASTPDVSLEQLSQHVPTDYWFQSRNFTIPVCPLIQTIGLELTVDDLDRFVKGGFSKRINRAYFKLTVELRQHFGRYL